MISIGTPLFQRVEDVLKPPIKRCGVVKEPIHVAMEKRYMIVRVWACGRSNTLSRLAETVVIFCEMKE